MHNRKRAQAETIEAAAAATAATAATALAAPLAWPAVKLSLARHPTLLAPGREPVPLAPRDAALLAWLALEGPTPRARLAALLWPGSETDAARNTLRQRLFQLRRQCGELVTGSSLLALAEGVSHDLAEADELLAGETPVEAGEFADWLQRRRLQARQRVGGSLAAQADEAERRGDFAAALAPARALLAHEPLSEDNHRRLMRLHYLAGDRAAALLAFDHCEQLLKHEVGTTPSGETLALLRQIEGATPAGGAPLPAPVGSVPVSVLRPPRLIGRDAELAALLAAWRLGQAVIVSGDAGLGKTRLLEDLVAAFGAQPGPAGPVGRTIVHTSARPGDERVVYASVSRLLRALPRERLLALDGPLRRALAPLLPELGELGESPPAGGEALRTALFNAVTALFGPGGLGLAGCVIDDLHFADEASIELLRYVAGQSGAAVAAAAPVDTCRWALGARAVELSPAGRAWFDMLCAEPQAVHRPLRPLDLAQVAELVDSLGIAALGGAAVAESLWRHTGGNPLYLLETVKAWLSAPAPSSAPPSTPALLPLRLPAAANVRTLIGRRITQLSPAAVKLARCAAVATPDFSIELAAQVLGLRTLDLADPWAELEAAQVLRDGVFAHDLIYEAALASVPAPVARQLHAEVAAFLTTHQGEPARLAAHWAAAGRWAPAAAAYLAAAERSHSAGRAVERAQLLAAAAEAFGRAGDDAARFDALRQRAEVLATNDLGLDARAAIDELVAAAHTPRQHLQALSAQLELAVTRFEVDEALKLAPQAVQDARTLGDRALELRLAVIWSGVLGDVRRTAEGVAVLEPYLDWVQVQQDAELQWSYWEARALALDYAGRLAESVQGWQTCQALARAAARPDWLWRSMSNAAAGQSKQGRVREACALSAQARQVALATGEVGRVRLLQMQSPHAHRLRDVGRYDEALPLLEEALQGLQAEGSDTDVTMAAQRLALLYFFLGQPARAQRTLAEVRPRVPPGIAMFQRVLQAELALATGGDALTPTREALGLIADTNDVFHRMATLFASRIVGAEEGEALAAGLAVWAGVQGRQGLAMSGHVRAAAAAAAQGAWRRALPHAQAALTLVVEHQPESFYQGEVWLVAARVLAALGREAEAQRALDDGWRWVMTVHDQHTPPPYRESFLQRNPVNRELLALHTRGLPPPA